MAAPTRAEFLKRLRSSGYTGVSELADIKSWLSDQGSPKLTIDGTDEEFTADQAWANVSTKALTFAAPAATATLTVKADDAAEIEAARAVKMRAEIESQLKAAGITAQGQRARQIDDERPSVKVKSSAQRRWENYTADGKSTCFKSWEKAAAFHEHLRISAGHLVGRQLIGHGLDGIAIADEATKRFKSYCDSQGYETKAFSTTSPTQGSALVPEIFVADLIKNVLDYGAARKLVRITQMMGQGETRPRYTGGLTAYYPEQNSAVTQSTSTYDNVTLNANTVAVLCQASMQIMQDARPDLADEIGQEIVRAHALKEDQEVLIGDASSTYGGVEGFVPKYGTTATDSGGYLIVGGDTTLLTTIGNINSVMGRLPTYAHAGAVWTCHNNIACNLFDRLAISTPGGLTWREFEGLGWIRVFLGRPVVINEVMASTTDASGDRVDALFGDFKRAAILGDLLNLTIEASSERGFDTLSVYFRGVLRRAVTVHSVGTTTAAGPVIALFQT